MSKFCTFFSGGKLIFVFYICFVLCVLITKISYLITMCEEIGLSTLRNRNYNLKPIIHWNTFYRLQIHKSNTSFEMLMTIWQILKTTQKGRNWVFSLKKINGAKRHNQISVDILWILPLMSFSWVLLLFIILSNWIFFLDFIFFVWLHIVEQSGYLSLCICRYTNI